MTPLTPRTLALALAGALALSGCTVTDSLDPMAHSDADHEVAQQTVDFDEREACTVTVWDSEISNTVAADDPSEVNMQIKVASHVKEPLEFSILEVQVHTNDGQQVTTSAEGFRGMTIMDQVVFPARFVLPKELDLIDVASVELTYRVGVAGDFTQRSIPFTTDWLVRKNSDLSPHYYYGPGAYDGPTGRYPAPGVYEGPTGRVEVSEEEPQAREASDEPEAAPTTSTK